jgi:hypothetical protein
MDISPRKRKFLILRIEFGKKKQFRQPISTRNIGTNQRALLSKELLVFPAFSAPRPSLLITIRTLFSCFRCSLRPVFD